MLRKYLESKGFIDETLDELALLKKSLEHENSGFVHSKIANSHHYEIKNFNINDIVIPNKNHYFMIEPRVAKPTIEGAPIVLGVLYVNNNGQHVLVDGYHRVKNAIENDNIDNGDFIILSPVKHKNLSLTY